MHGMQSHLPLSKPTNFPRSNVRRATDVRKQLNLQHDKTLLD
jgi:hypothetical protein